MKTAIIYASHHHGNTEKLVKELANKYPITLINADEELTDTFEYDCIGYASGIEFNKFYDSVVKAAEKTMAEGKNVFFLYTCAQNSKDFSVNLKQLAIERRCFVLGSFGCKGYNTYGPLKLIGGMNRKHPDEKDIASAASFYEECVSK